MMVKKIIIFLGTALILSGCYQKTADIRVPVQQLANSVQQLNQKVDDLSNRVETVEDTTNVNKNTNTAAGNVNADTEIVTSVACPGIVNATFSSVREYGCGMVPTGQPATKCHFELKFFSDRYEWGHDDMIDQGSYTCSNNVIKASTSYPYGDINATYDPSTKLLRWKDGSEYRRL